MSGARSSASRRCDRAWAAVCGLALAALAACGCPATVLDGGQLEAPALLSPGLYLVQQRAEGFEVYPPGPGRSAPGWTTLSTTEGLDHVYRGPGLYELDEQGRWSWVAELMPDEWDAFIQLYDPAPAAHPDLAR